MFFVLIEHQKIDFILQDIFLLAKYYYEFPKYILSPVYIRNKILNKRSQF